MEPFSSLTATALPLDVVNLDTDQLFPARFLPRPLDDRYSTYLFHDLRWSSDGSPNPEFLLNHATFREARIIVGAENFGCGSSREAAVFALAAYGFRAVIAPSFGDTFFNNCIKNGVVPVRLPDGTVTAMRAWLRQEPGSPITVDLEAQEVRSPAHPAHAFALDPHARHCLLHGLDEIELTLQHAREIAQHEERTRLRAAWLSRKP